MEMDFEELQDELTARISASSASGFFTDAQKKLWLNMAGQRVCDFYNWPFLQLALEIQTANDSEYYDYPSGVVRFKPNSIYQIDIEDEDYARGVSGRRRIPWEMFQKKKQEDDDELVYTNHNGFYFLHPIPTNGKTMSIYGVKGWKVLVNNTDVPVTPYECNEAIIRIALASALRKSKKYGEAKSELVEVLDPNIGILAQIKNQIEAEAPQGYAGEAESSRWNNG